MPRICEELRPRARACALEPASLRRTSNSSILGGHGYATVRLTGDEMRTEFVCIPRPITRSERPDGGPLRYRVVHTAQAVARRASGRSSRSRCSKAIPACRSSAGRADLNAGWYWQALCVATALACGLLIGIERGFDLRGLRAGTRVAGVRTFTLVGLASGLAGLAGQFGQPFAAGALVAGLRRRARDRLCQPARHQAKPDATTPVAALATVGLGFIAGFGEPGFAIAGAAVVTLLLALKAELHGFARQARRGRCEGAGALRGHRRRGPAVPARAAITARSARGTRRSCGWWSCWSPASRSSAMSPTASSASGTGPSPPR